MNNEQNMALIEGLKACEINYRYSTSKHGNVSPTELSLWEAQLADLNPKEISRCFQLHIQNSNFFPTISDIRNAKQQYDDRLQRDRWIEFPEQKQITNQTQMPEKVKEMLKKLSDKHDVKKLKQQQTTSKPPNRVIIDTGERMTQEEMDKIYYRNTA
jgi:hypothetical protein